MNNICLCKKCSTVLKRVYKREPRSTMPFQGKCKSCDSREPVEFFSEVVVFKDKARR